MLEAPVGNLTRCLATIRGGSQFPFPLGSLKAREWYIRQAGVQFDGCYGIFEAQEKEVRTALESFEQDSLVAFCVFSEERWKGLVGRNIGGVVFDLDSTLIKEETIDTLAQIFLGAKGHAEVKKVTSMAMRGELDFEESLRKRVGLFRGVSYKALLMGFVPTISTGQRELIDELRSLGCSRLEIVSGGFYPWASQVATELRIDQATANTFAVKDGLLTGGLIGDVSDAMTKVTRVEAVREKTEGFVVAIGDGGNDLKMFKAADLSVSFCGKKVAREAADVVLNIADARALIPILRSIIELKF